MLPLLLTIGLITSLSETNTQSPTVYSLHRGFYVSGDIGLFVRLHPKISRPTSYTGIKAGFDLGDHFGVQLFVAQAVIVSDQDEGTTSQGVLHYGGECLLSLRPLPRFAIEPRAGFGRAWVSPSRRVLGTTLPTDTESSWIVLAGVDYRYLTLLSDFSVGLTTTIVRFLNTTVNALSISGNLRYTF